MFFLKLLVQQSQTKFKVKKQYASKKHNFIIHIKSHEVIHNVKQFHVQCTKSQKVKKSIILSTKRMLVVYIEW